MKRLSTAIMVLGLLILIHALTSEISIKSYGGDRIANASLMHNRLVSFILAGFVIFGGLALKIFKEKLTTPSGHLERIDAFSSREYTLRIITIILGGWCIWTMLLSYTIPSYFLIAIITIFIGWISLTKKDTFSTLKNIWKKIFVLASIISIIHGIALSAELINIFTLALIANGVPKLNTPNLFYIYGAYILVPLLASGLALIYSDKYSQAVN